MTEPDLRGAPATVEVPDFPAAADVREDVGVVLGLDVGQLADPACLAAVQCWCTSAWLRHGEPVPAESVVLARQEWPPGMKDARWRDRDLGITEVKVRSFGLIALDTFPLGTPYPVVARRAAAALRHPALHGRRDARGRLLRPDPVLVIDATAGIGGMTDLLREVGLTCWRTLIPLTLTGGGEAEHRTGVGMSARVAVPKRLLIGALRNQFLSQRLRMAADLPERAAFITELENFEVTLTPTGHDRYAGRAGTHDDRVMAAAMAVWWGLQRPLPERGEYVIMPPEMI